MLSATQNANAEPSRSGMHSKDHKMHPEILICRQMAKSRHMWWMRPYILNFVRNRALFASAGHVVGKANVIHGNVYCFALVYMRLAAKVIQGCAATYLHTACS